MIKFFRRIRKRLLRDGKFTKYVIYALGEIFLVVIGILIAVGIGEWRLDIKKEKELISYYKGLKDDLNKDKVRLDTLISVIEKASLGITNELDEIQLSTYNEDSLYSNVPAWLVYVTEFAPHNSNFTEILSSGKLQLFNNKDLKLKILNIYSNLYPELQFRQNASNEFIRDNRTDKLMDTFRWMKLLDNDGSAETNVILKNPKYHIRHDWVYDKQSVKYLEFENYLALTKAAYMGYIKRYKKIREEVKSLIILIEDELKLFTE